MTSCIHQGTLWFNIGSADTFERNLENAQLEMNIEPQNHVPVVYKVELEPSHLISYLPTMIMLALVIYGLRRSADLMGGRGGRKGGLFGGVMESTAKLINPSEIGVRFKYVLIQLIFLIYFDNYQWSY